MAKSFKESQIKNRELAHRALIGDCRILEKNSSRVEAIKKYRAATGASLKDAQKALKY